MPTSHIDIPTSALDDPVVAALGGRPLPEPAVPGDEKDLRRRHKHEAKVRRDAERPPKSFERFRILMDVVDQGRRVVDLCDHKARYALVVMGILNAGVFFLMSRAHAMVGLSEGVRPWLIGVLVAYAGLTFAFVFHAIDCLRPRQMRYSASIPDDPGATKHRPLGLMYWETIALHELDAYGRAWSTVRMEQLNAELVLVSHHLARLIRAKYVALGRLYWGLVLLVALAAVILAAYTAFAIGK